MRHGMKRVGSKWKMGDLDPIPLDPTRSHLQHGRLLPFVLRVVRGHSFHVFF